MSTVPSISTKSTSHLKSLNTNKTTTNDIGNPGSCLEQAHKCGGVKPVKDINTLPS